MNYSIIELVKVVISLTAALSSVLVAFFSLNKIRKKADDAKDFTQIVEEIKSATKIQQTKRQEKPNEVENSLVNSEHPNETDEFEAEKYALFLQYHSQGLSQSKISFWFSLIFASIGFAIIVMGILTVSNGTSAAKAYLSMISGTIIDAVSALFFVQSNKARQLMIEFFDKLRSDRKFDESLKLANQISDSHLQSKLKVLLSLNFGDIVVSEKTLELVLDGIERRKITNDNL